MKKLLFVLCITLSIASECPMTGNDPTGNQNSNGNDNTSNGDTATLTLRLIGPANGDLGRVYGIVNDGPQSHADLENRVPQSDFQLTLSSGIGTGMIEQSYSYPKGTEIALVATEADGSLSPSAPTLPHATVPLQFSNWDADFGTSDLGPNNATLHFTLDEDRTIEAHFTAMNFVYITADGGGPHSNMLISVDVDRYIIPPRPVEDSGVGVNSIADDHILSGFLRDGAILTLEIKDYTDNAPAACTNGPECWVFVSWEGDCVGSSKICAITVVSDADAKVILEDQF